MNKILLAKKGRKGLGVDVVAPILLGEGWNKLSNDLKKAYERLYNANWEFFDNLYLNKKKELYDEAINYPNLSIFFKEDKLNPLLETTEIVEPSEEVKIKARTSINPIEKVKKSKPKLVKKKTATLKAADKPKEKTLLELVLEKYPDMGWTQLEVEGFNNLLDFEDKLLTGTYWHLVDSTDMTPVTRNRNKQIWKNNGKTTFVQGSSDNQYLNSSDGSITKLVPKTVNRTVYYTWTHLGNEYGYVPETKKTYKFLNSNNNVELKKLSPSTVVSNLSSSNIPDKPKNAVSDFLLHKTNKSSDQFYTYKTTSGTPVYYRKNSGGDYMPLIQSYHPAIGYHWIWRQNDGQVVRISPLTFERIKLVPKSNK